MVFVSGDIRYVKWRKIRSDTCFSAAFFLFPRTHGFVRALGNFSVMALMLVFAASEHLGELNLRGIGSGSVDTLRFGYLGDLNYLGGIGSGRR